MIATISGVSTEAYVLAKKIEKSFRDTQKFNFRLVGALPV